MVVFFDDNSFVVSEGDGERLFNEDGSTSPIFNHYVELLSKIEKSNQQLEVSCSVLEQSAILEPLVIEVGADGEAKNKIDGLFKINPEKFKALDSKQVLEMHEKNTLDLIYAHFFSMGGFERLGRTKKIEQ